MYQSMYFSPNTEKNQEARQPSPEIAQIYLIQF